MCDPSPQVCNLDHVVTKHTSTAVYEAPDPLVDSVRISTMLTHTQRSLFLSPFISLLSLTLYQHSLIQALPQISWIHLWPPHHPLYWNPWISQLHCAASMANL